MTHVEVSMCSQWSYGGLPKFFELAGCGGTNNILTTFHRDKIYFMHLNLATCFMIPCILDCIMGSTIITCFLCFKGIWFYIVEGLWKYHLTIFQLVMCTDEYSEFSAASVSISWDCRRASPYRSSCTCLHGPDRWPDSWWPRMRAHPSHAPVSGISFFSSLIFFGVCRCGRRYYMRHFKLLNMCSESCVDSLYNFKVGGCRPLWQQTSPFRSKISRL